MAVILEKEGTKRQTLEININEPFTQKPFAELIHESRRRAVDYYFSRVITKMSVTCYDARQLCKYIFEIMISPECRKIRIKNMKDPLNGQIITDVHFFKLRFDSETPLRAEYVGNHLDFLESSCFRSKIYREDALYALSVNFCFREVKNYPVFGKKQVLSLFITIIFVLMVSTFLILILEREKNGAFNVKPLFPSKMW